jgi:hypothetical protein
MIAIDTNLLIYAHRSLTAEHARARRAIERAAADPRGWGFTLTNLLEFWSIVTHAKASGRPSTTAEASSFVQALVHSARAHIWSPSEGFAQRLTQLAAGLRVSGPRIFDLTIALMAFENGASEIWTHDRGFVTVPGLRVRDPFTAGS